MRDLQTCLIQTGIEPNDPEANLTAYETLLDQAHGHDLVVLPEVFTTGFSAQAREYAEEEGGRVYHWLTDWAHRLQAVITGSVVIQEEGQYYNRLIWMRPDGSYQHYDKRHLFRMAGEHKRYAMGVERRVFELKGWRILPMICYDLRFPVWSRNRGDYDLALYVANWPAARALHWQRLLQARAIENLSYVLGVNRIGQDEKGQAYQGDSAVYGPAGEPLVEAGSAKGCFSSTLKGKALLDYRSRFPADLDADDFSLKI